MGLRPTSTASWRSASAPPPPLSDDSGKATAIVAAAGSGERLGAGGPKALLELGGRPMLAWSLEALSRADGVDAIVVALPAGAEAALPQGVVRVDGGATRAESVANALARAETGLVVIHDAARPLVTIELAEAVLERLRSRSDVDGVIAAAPLADTVKRAGDDRVIRTTEDRRELWGAQTPQAFRTEKLRAAYTADPQRVAAATDEAMLIEHAGGTVLIEPAPASNLKVTTPEDLQIAEALLTQR